ncbi:MAG: TRAP transporter substrate-binding protein [Methyloligellaceae bacterium]
MRLTSKAVIATALSGVYFLFGLSFSLPVSAQTELLINNYLPPKHPFQVGIVEPWIKQVIEATKGSVTPKLSAGRVGPPPKNWQTVTKGVADVVVLANVFQPKRIQLPTISQLPLNSPSAEKTSIALWETHQKFFAKADEYKGAKLLGSFVGSPNVIHHGSKPINSVADLKGVKLRAAPGISTKILKQAGAVPVASGPAKIFNLVSKGVVDGVAVPAYGLRSFRIMPYVKFTTTIPGGLTNTSFSFLVNQAKWDSLSKEQQAQIMKVSGRVISENARKVDEVSSASLEALKKEGGQVIKASPEFIEEIRKLALGAENEWKKAALAKGIDADAALAFYREQLK